MKILSQQDNKFLNITLLKKFNRFKLKDKFLIIKVCILMALMRGTILIVPFKNLKNFMGELNKESSFNLSDNDYNVARRISWCIKKVAKYTPWESKCFVQALTAQYLLSKSNIESTLYLGVSKINNIMIGNENIKNIKDKGKTNLVAHSWIRCGNYYITGGNGNDFKVVAKFLK